MTNKAQKWKLPKPCIITLPADTYQPPKAERETEHSMPGASMKTVQRAFFRPINVLRKGSK